MHAFTDNKSLFRSAYATTTGMPAKNILKIDMSAIKQLIENSMLTNLSWIPKDEQLADCLTKAGANPLSLLLTLEKGQLAV